MSEGYCLKLPTTGLDKVDQSQCRCCKQMWLCCHLWCMKLIAMAHRLARMRVLNCFQAH